jgi:hypothetical protein
VNVVGDARPSMFGLRWITAVSMNWHARADCPALKASRTRNGWTAFPITLGHGAQFYPPCHRCTRPSETHDSKIAWLPNGD